jgi:hypothetical protein
MKPQELVTKTTLMTCPCCLLNIQAQVTAVVTLTPGEIDGATVKVDAKTTMTQFDVQHACPGLPASDEAQS